MMAYTIGIGIIAGFLFTELSGWYAGGLIVPGYLAFFWNQPFRIGMSLLVALAVYGLLIALSQVTILYGRRRFMAAVILGYLLGEAARMLLVRITPPVGEDLRIIGYVIPGLIANDMVKQGIWRTLFSVLIVAGITRCLFLLVVG